MTNRTYSINGLSTEELQYLQAADDMRDALRKFIKWNDQPVTLPPDGSREDIAVAARAALKKAGVPE